MRLALTGPELSRASSRLSAVAPRPAIAPTPDSLPMRHLMTAAAAAFAMTLMPAAHGHGNAHDGRKHLPPNLEPVEKPFGRTGDPQKVTRTVRISGSDAMRFSPAELTVRQGETIRFVVRNEGKVMHELVLGTLQELAQHAEWMRRFPNMEHEEPYMVHLAPGQSGEVIWQFTRPGDFHFGCLVPGHFEAGMKGRIRVVANPA
jgi:uncharacterized cupredoxin-like copper-binding protein